MGSGEEVLLAVGPGPVTLGQGPYLQYIAARACRLLRGMGFKVLVLEDNPATLMDLGSEAGELFMEPPAPEVVERIAEHYEVKSIVYSLGGRRAWSLALRLAGEGWYGRLGISPVGPEDRILWLCGDRTLLRETLEARGVPNPRFRAARNMREGQEAADQLGFPLAVRPHFSSGGWGAGLAYNLEEYPLLFEEALRESMSGEVLVEEALIGWRKYIALVLRDGRGSTALAGMLEQIEPLPLHDQDAVLVCPPPSLGGEELYALRTMALETGEALELVGLAEVKMAAKPDWSAAFVIDVNPWPWRNLPLLETALGKDLLRVHLRLTLGEHISAMGMDWDGHRPSGVMLAVPWGGCEDRIDVEEGYRRLGCMSAGKTVFREKTVEETAARAMEELGKDIDGGGGEALLETLSTLRRPRRKRGIRREEAEWLAREGEAKGASYCFCLAATSPAVAGKKVLFLSGQASDAGGGFEQEANCLQAMAAWRGKGGGAFLYTPNPHLALFAAGEADGVFLGPLAERAVEEAAALMGVEGVVAHYGGAYALSCAAHLVRQGVEVWGGEETQREWGIKETLQKVRSAGLPVSAFGVSRGVEEGMSVLAKARYPVMATVEAQRGEKVHQLIYDAHDGGRFLRLYPDEEVLWREVHEEAREIQVEAVGFEGGEHLVVLWEQLDEAGMCPSDGLAVYPALYLTSEQSREVAELAARVVDVLGWRGNLSLKISLSDGESFLWDVSKGASANLPFIYRASSVPMAAAGVLALGGEKRPWQTASVPFSTVRTPLIPFSTIARSDVLPSPQRRSSGSVMGMARDPGTALAKALWSMGIVPKPGGKALLSVANREKRRAVLLARELQEAGYGLMATRGTYHALAASGIQAEKVDKLREGRPNVLDNIRNGQVNLVVNVPRGKHPQSDGFYIRAASALHGIPCITNMDVALALARALRESDPGAWEILSLAEYCRPGAGLRVGE